MMHMLDPMARYLHTMLRITDPERSRAFYEALGFEARRDHRQDEAPALPNQFVISSGISLANGLRDMSEIELDRATATRLEINEQQPFRGPQYVPWVWLAVQQLLARGLLLDPAVATPECPK
jgi:catechol 2,3-dioxygenase-like lactoylglutathione lyase family enzyme